MTETPDWADEKAKDLHWQIMEVIADEDKEREAIAQALRDERESCAVVVEALIYAESQMVELLRRDTKARRQHLHGRGLLKQALEDIRNQP